MLEADLSILLQLMAMDELGEWDRCHAPAVDATARGSKRAAVPSRLFTDEDPATTIKGLGFRDPAVARATIRLAGQPGCAYKQYWTIKAMAERARHHPHRSASMSAALEILDSWLDARREQRTGAAPPPPPQEERQQRQLLATSAANAHARSRCASDAEHAALLAADRRAGLRALRAAASDVLFPLPATAFVSIFGGPGDHGYGKHRCEAAAAAGLAGWRCTCAFGSRHVVDVSSAGAENLRVGTRGSGFRLTFHGSDQTATLRGAAGSGQSTLSTFFQKVPSHLRAVERPREPVLVSQACAAPESAGDAIVESHAMPSKRPRLRS